MIWQRHIQNLQKNGIQQKTALYGAVYLTNVVFTRHWKDFYNLYAGGRWYLSAIVMLAASFVLGAFLWGAHRLFFSVLFRKQRTP